MHTAARVDARIKQQLVKPIIDSGASVSIISRTMAEKLKIKYDKKEDEDKKNKEEKTPKVSLSITGVDGEEKGVLGIAKRVPVAIMDALVLIDFMVIESKQDIILLEMDWIKIHKLNLLFRTNEVELEYQGRLIRVKVETTQGHEV